MIVNKENMIDALQKLIEIEKNNKFNTPMDNAHDIEIYKIGYVGALEDLLYAINVNGE